VPECQRKRESKPLLSTTKDEQHSGVPGDQKRMLQIENHLYNRRQFLRWGGLSLVGLGWTGRARAQVAAEQPLPTRAAADRLDGPPIVSARAWAIVDGAGGRLLWGANEARALGMASTTKIMTAWLPLRLAVTNPNLLDESIVVSAEAAGTRGSSARVRAGERYPLRDLLYGVLLPSGNDAAVALAEHFGRRYEPKSRGVPAVRAFVTEMNRQAEALRLAQTRYVDPHGLGEDRTSAHDLATLAWHAMEIRLFRDYVRTRRHQCQVTDAKGTHRTLVWNSTNKLLEIEGYDGIKTGTTTAAGSCLVASGRHDADHLIVAVLGCTSNDSRYIDCRNLFRWAWRQRGHTR